ncbi:hypothetical protein HMPREF9514_02538, partial [Enterococcus faecalis TX0855]
FDFQTLQQNPLFLLRFPTIVIASKCNFGSGVYIICRFNRLLETAGFFGLIFFPEFSLLLFIIFAPCEIFGTKKGRVESQNKFRLYPFVQFVLYSKSKLDIIIFE